ncbi:hypothetical protein DERP_004824 [Dermatophagoides pteronyssinus]|uniref:Secreted protein n=1 Tax=Dermatophagoides pteronyssinus TaxID=6956 RepID=A0ABQ8JT36_DERPT|nr:hypothetical protein DERP_004824 [Dermatophagoides pteronyssinus]
MRIHSFRFLWQTSYWIVVIFTICQDILDYYSVYKQNRFQLEKLLFGRYKRKQNSKVLILSIHMTQ